MELKKYQQEVLDCIDQYNQQLNLTNDLGKAFRAYWESKGVTLTNGDYYLHQYVNSVPGVPRVTLKVPTAGGKTFIACNALRRVFNIFPEGQPKVVAWFVPSDTILKQTYRRLSDPTDPYRQRIDTLFNGKVRVYEKEELLVGSNFNPVVVREQLSILVLSIQSFASNNKEGRRSYRENENMTDFVATYTNETPRVADADETALIQVIASLNPVVIIDESHNVGSELRVSTLKEINPKYILELTATPKETSNVICFVDAGKLKRENMVKLPVIVYNHSRIENVISGAIQLQRNLERQAKEAERHGGDYIRPIVLFQAQPRTGEETTTYDKVKAHLIESGIPAEQVKIKTSEKDELKGIDLMSRDCEVRFIITVDALKEGWDCSFAYILASLANRTSRISVEQILGRVLRQPYTRRQAVEFLNLSYVFTNSANFQSTLDCILCSLQNSGFSGKDYVALENNEETDIPQNRAPMQQDLFGFGNQPEPMPYAEEGADDIEAIDSVVVREGIEQAEYGNCSEDIGNMLAQASTQVTQYNQVLAATAQRNNEIPNEMASRIKYSEMKGIFAETAKELRLPQFYIKVKTTQNLFFNAEDETELLLTSEKLLDEFDLTVCDRSISFNTMADNAVQIDLEAMRENESVPKFRYLNERQLKVFGEYMQGLSVEAKITEFTNTLTRNIERTFDKIGHRSLRSYIESILRAQEGYKLDDLANNLIATQTTIENKIKSLANEYKKKRFKDLLDTGRIYIKESYALPDSIIPKNSRLGITKSLYVEENEMNDFEKRVISQIANNEKVLFWHRNFERGKGFHINGFINHYPDFIVVLTNGKVLLIETKGDQLDGSDSEDKILLGSYWANKAGDKYRYYMVFDNKEVDGAKTLPNLLETIDWMV